MRGLYFLYFRRILPFIGRLVSKHKTAYTWLPESVLAFPEPDGLAERMRQAGFREVRYRLLMGGICAVHVGVRGETREVGSVRGSRSVNRARGGMVDHLPGGTG